MALRLKKAHIPQKISIICYLSNILWCYIFVYVLNLGIIGIATSRNITLMSHLVFLHFKVKKDKELSSIIRPFKFEEVKENYK